MFILANIFTLVIMFVLTLSGAVVYSFKSPFILNFIISSSGVGSKWISVASIFIASVRIFLTILTVGIFSKSYSRSAIINHPIFYSLIQL